MIRNQTEWNHEYLVSPSEYDGTLERLTSTYDQFIQLRDTLIYSGKKYKGKGGSRLIIWEKEETVEIMWKNGFKLSFEPNISMETNVINYHEWPYVEYTPKEWDFTSNDGFLKQHWYDFAKRTQRFWLISCRILKDWNYRIEYKVQVWSQATPIPAGTGKIYAFVIRYKYRNDKLVPRSIWAKDVDPDTQTWDRFHIAVWDLEQPYQEIQGQKIYWRHTINVSWQTLWTDPNWTCTASWVLNLSLWDLYKKITAIGFNDTNLNKNDVLSFHVVDQDFNSLDSILQANSNFFSVKYSEFTLL